MMSADPVFDAQRALRSRERYRRILVSGTTMTASKVVSAVAGILSVPLLMNYLGKEAFGLWMVVSSLVIWMQLTDFGIGSGVGNAMAEAFGRDDPVSAAGYLSSGYVLSGCIAFSCVPILLLLYVYIPWDVVLNVQNASLALYANDVVLVVGLAFLANMPLSLAGRAFTAFQRGDVLSVCQVASSLTTLAAQWLAIEMKLGLVVIAGITAAVPVSASVALLMLLRRLDDRLRVSWRGVRRESIVRLKASSLPLFFLQCGTLLVNQLVNVLLAQLGSLQLVAEYNVVMRVYSFAFTAASAISNPFYPALRDAFERGESAWIRKAVRVSLAARAAATVPSVAVFLLAGDHLLRSWIGPTSPALGYFGWMLVSLSLIFASVSSLLSEVLSSLDDITAQIKVVFISAVIVVGLMSCLIPPLGVSGVFAAMVCSTLYPIFWAGRRIHLTVRNM